MAGLKSVFVLITGVFGAAVLAANSAVAQSYPSKPVRIIVNQPAAGGTDATGRVIAQGLQEILGKPFVIENIVGASGAIGIDLVKRAEPDGHTLLFTASIAVTNQAANPKAAYDIITDLTPITQVGEASYLMAIKPQIAAGNAKELAAYSNTKELNWGISQFGGGDHFASAQFVNASGAKALLVPFKGAGQAITALISGEIDVLISPPSVILPQAAAGKIKAIGVTGARRMDQMPNVMTVAEAGYPGYDHTTWFGMWGPKGMSPALVSTIQQAVVGALKLPKTVEVLNKSATNPVGSRPDDFAALIARTLKEYRAVAVAAKIKLE